MAEPQAQWVFAAKHEALRLKGRMVVKFGKKQILLIAAEGKLFACNNRCPHEGYPLSEGTLSPGCALTCNWHNWKFDLSSGATLVGGDLLRTYPLEVRGPDIFIDIADAPAERQRTRALESLIVAMDDNDQQRMAREIARLMKAGVDPLDALREAITFSADRFEFGMNHGYAAAADWLALHDATNDPALRLVALVEPVAHIAEDTLRQPRFAYDTGSTLWDAAAFLAAIETENEPEAIRLVRGALKSGLHFASLRPTFTQAALAHYQDFGHAVIYTFKAGQLIERLGPSIEEPVLLALTRSLIFATREDLIPEFRGYGPAVRDWSAQGRKPPHAEDFVGLSVNAALGRVLESSSDIPALYDALLGAAAWNWGHFDRSIDEANDKPVSHNVGWLDFSHSLTFANAARHLCAERPDLWPSALLQLACFIGRNKPFVDKAVALDEWRVANTSAFLAHEQENLFNHGVPEPIVSCHRIKVVTALKDELAAAPNAPWQNDLLAAVNRYLNSPFRRHQTLRTARQSLSFVAAEG